MMLIRATLDTVMLSNQYQETTLVKIHRISSHLSQSMKLLKLIINLPVMLKWMLILLIKQLASLVRILTKQKQLLVFPLVFNSSQLVEHL